MKTIPYVIAEMGVNFYDTARIKETTPLEAAKLYIDAAKSAGINCAKFQSYKAGTIASKNSPAYWDTTKEPTQSQYELFTKFDRFNADDYGELCDYTHKMGMDFTSTPFDYYSADYLFELVDFYKISSSDITNLPFISYIAKKGKPVYLSTGASFLSEVEEAVRILRQSGCEDIVLMHCVLSYPTLPDDANLAVIETLRNVFPDLRIGYSDHVAPDRNMNTLTTAYMLGAEVIEKHFTLDKAIPGNDHYHAGTPDDFRLAIDSFRWINRVTGESLKTVLPCEETPRREARRSLVLTRDMKKGELIEEQDIVAKRPGTGIPPRFADVVVGREVKCDLPEDTILQWDFI